MDQETVQTLSTIITTKVKSQPELETMTVNRIENNISIDGEHVFDENEEDVDEDQNPIKSIMTGTTNKISMEYPTATISNLIINWPNSSSSIETNRLDESIITGPFTTLTTTASSSPLPIEMNQNELYEMVNSTNRTVNTTNTITSTTTIQTFTKNSDVEYSIKDIQPNPTTSTIATTTLSINKTSTKKPFKSKICGIRPLRPMGRVVGGRNAHFGEWPWQVLIKEKSWLGIFTKSKCGGVLIDYKWILTAAHCQPGMMGSLIVMLGQHELYVSPRQFRPVVKTVKRMIIHKHFNPDTFDNDIALLELDTPFEMQPHIVPICLPDQDDDYVGKYAFVAGWGKLSYGGLIPRILQTVRLPIIDNKVCQTMFADAGHYKYIKNSFLCAGYSQGGRDTCEGDSGGPLMMKQDDVWTLIGTVSHGIKCAEPNLPGVYMKTWSYLPWINGIINKNR